MASLCGDLVAHHTARLERRLSAVHGRPDAAVAHAARIAGKRLRYLLEPLIPSLEGARSLVRRLTKMQDVLGDLRDAQLAVDTLEDRTAGVPERSAQAERLLTAARAGVDSAYARFEREIHGSHAESLLVEANTVAAYLATAHTRVEIERKFLLSALPAIARRSPSAAIDQGYLPGVAIEERVRRTVNGDQKQFHRTVKMGAGLERTEIEEELAEEEFQKLWRMTRGRRVHKRRYYVMEGEITWEIDRFRDPAIVVAEVELASASGDVPFPSWLQSVLVREVTDDPEYSNARMAH
jgi:CYTH domain-containing protein